jgi:NAD(P)-dependent dehydrogenase (short-subunit alcohol dehydrogenase family)
VAENGALARETFDGIDSLVENAAIGTTRKRLLELSIDERKRFLRVDLSGGLLFCQAVGPLLLEQGRAGSFELSPIPILVGTAQQHPLRGR